MNKLNSHFDNWSFEKEIVFEGGGAISVSIAYCDATPENAIQIISGLEILTNELAEKVELLRTTK